MSFKLYKMIEQFFDNPKDALILRAGKVKKKKISVCNVMWKVSAK